jgi:hypothetical protein
MVIRGIKAGIASDVAAVEGLTADIQSITARQEQINRSLTGHVRQYNKASSACRSS